MIFGACAGSLYRMVFKAERRWQHYGSHIKNVYNIWYSVKLTLCILLCLAMLTQTYIYHQ